MKNYQIYQLNDTPENSDIMFMNYDWLEKQNRQVDLNNYRCVYQGTMEPGMSLEDLFRKFNVDIPSDFRGHSLSVSDVILTYDDTGAQAHYVDSIGFKEIAVFPMNDLEKTDLSQPEPKSYVPLYRHSREFAVSAGEKEAYRASHLENIHCRQAIDKAISEHFDGMHLDTSCVRPLIDEYGIDRMEWVLANTLILKDFDGRFSRNNKSWGASIGVPIDNDGYGSVRNDAFELQSHPAVLDGFISAVRKEIGLIREQEAEQAQTVRQETKDTMTVLVVEPGEKPYEKEIRTGLDSLQNAVGGYIQAVYPYDEPVAIVCDEEGKLNGKEMNRALRDEEGHIYDVISGTFLVVGLTGEDFGSLNANQLKQFKEKFDTPEMFVRSGGKLVVIPIREDNQPSRPSLRAALHEKQETVAKQSPAHSHEQTRKGRDAIE